MGRYLNPDSNKFEINKTSKIYVDKTKLISFTNSVVNTMNRFICVSRPRRFGKSMAADMLAAYYGCGEDSRELFEDLRISSDESFEKHLNKYYVIKVDMQTFMTKTSSAKEMLELFERRIRNDLKKQTFEDEWLEDDDLSENLYAIYEHSGKEFVILIDEWDCVMRRYHSLEDKKLYLDYLRNLLKDQEYVALAYMTGILPVKKYGEHSTLNMFDEYSMFDSADISDCFGFTEEEVALLCEKYKMDFEETKEWYDGYHLISNVGGVRKDFSIYSPKSIVESMLRHKFGSYWSQTESYDALKEYIQMNFDGLKDSITELLAGGSVEIDPGSFKNDMFDFYSKNDILTLLVHLGYLAYGEEGSKVSIPNKEVAGEFVRSVNNSERYKDIAEYLKRSKELIEDLWNGDEEAVAAGVEKAHQQFPSIRYNNENSLSCTIELAFYYAREYYTIVRELPTGKGYADICFIPKPRHADKPAVVVELKWNKSAEAAIEQIKRKEYPDALSAYHGNLILCGINYDKDDEKENKQHKCMIERLEK